MRKTNKTYRVKWGTTVLYSDIYEYVLIGKSSLLVIYETETNNIVFSSKFKYTCKALESRKHNCVLVANTLGQIMRIDYQTNTSKSLKCKIGDMKKCFLSHNEDYAVFISMERKILVMEIETCVIVTCYNYEDVFGEDGVIAFIKTLPPSGYEFALWDRRIKKLSAVSFDIINKSYVEIENPSLLVSFEDKEICHFVYSPELDCYVSLHDKSDYFHVKIIQGGEPVFSFNTRFDALSCLKIIYRNESEAYICLSQETILIFDFTNYKIKKIYRSTEGNIMNLAYNRGADEFVLIYAFYTSDTITIDDFSDFDGFDTEEDG